MLARCSMTVVTMWLPFSLYISATPLRARLIASVPPEVKTSSFGSRAPISVAILARAASTAPSASHPNGWFRLAGWPNFSVKYGSIASTTRGSHGVVDCASMKIGSFNELDGAIDSVSCPFLRVGLQTEELRHVLARQLGQAHRVQHVADRGLYFLHGPPQVTPLHLRTFARPLETLHDRDRPLQGPDDLADPDAHRPSGQDVAAFRAVL